MPFDGGSKSSARPQWGKTWSPFAYGVGIYLKLIHLTKGAVMSSVFHQIITRTMQVQVVPNLRNPESESESAIVMCGMEDSLATSISSI